MRCAEAEQRAVQSLGPRIGRHSVQHGRAEQSTADHQQGSPKSPEAPPRRTPAKAGQGKGRVEQQAGRERCPRWHAGGPTEPERGSQQRQAEAKSRSAPRRKGRPEQQGQQTRLSDCADDSPERIDPLQVTTPPFR